MDIKGISGSQFVPKQVNGKNQKDFPENTPGTTSDKIEISEAAKLMQKNSAETARLDAIKEKIKNNFYNSNEVIEATANAILKELKGE